MADDKPYIELDFEDDWPSGDGVPEYDSMKPLLVHIKDLNRMCIEVTAEYEKDFVVLTQEEDDG